MLRSLIDDEDRAALSAAILELSFLDIPLIHMSVYWWRTLHHAVDPAPDKLPWENVHPVQHPGDQFCWILLLYFYLLSLRLRLGEVRSEIKTCRLNQGAY